MATGLITDVTRGRQGRNSNLLETGSGCGQTNSSTVIERAMRLWCVPVSCFVQDQLCQSEATCEAIHGGPALHSNLASSLFASSGGDASEDYEEFIGAKKHLVLGLLSSHTDQGSTSKIQWWKRSSGDGVAISAGIVSSVVGR
jgi:hypothetical protein